MLIAKGHKIIRLFLLALTCLIVINNKAISQTRISSPYTMYGLGEVYFNNNFRNLGMGGLAIGFQSNTSVNFVNPASYAGFDNRSFVFDAMAFSHLYEQSTPEQNQRSNYSSIGNLLFGFPVKSWWSSAFGLTPYSSLGYKVYDKQLIEDIGAVDFVYEGTGGIHHIFWGNAFKPWKGLSIGVNTAYLFGNLKDNVDISSDSANFFLSNQQRTVSANGFMFNFGVQYKNTISEDRNFTLGLIFGNQTNINATENFMQRIYIPGITFPDTILNHVNEEGKLTLPAYWGVGLSKKFNSNWTAGADFFNQNWTNFKYFEKSQNLNNLYQVALGARFSPNQTASANFFTRANYTAGVRYKQTYIIHNTHPVNEFGLGLGVNFRLRRSLSGMTFAFEWANRGDINNNKLREDIYRINVGINIHERWFIRTKFL